MNLSGFSVVSTDGTFVDAGTCYLLDTSKLDEKQLDTLNEGTDEERTELAEEHGLDLEEAIMLKKGKSIFSVIAYCNGVATVMRTFADQDRAFEYWSLLKEGPPSTISYCISISRIE
jgi:hypothetical protein